MSLWCLQLPMAPVGNSSRDIVLTHSLTVTTFTPLLIYPSPKQIPYLWKILFLDAPVPLSSTISAFYTEITFSLRNNY